jgi:hypothetical protein
MMENVIRYFVVVYKDGFVTKEFSLDELQSGVVTLDAIIEPIDVVVTETEVILNPIYGNNKSNISSKS